MYLSTIEALALAVDAKDQITHGHIRRVQVYTVELAKTLGVQDRAPAESDRSGGTVTRHGQARDPRAHLEQAWETDAAPNSTR